MKGLRAGAGSLLALLLCAAPLPAQTPAATPPAAGATPPAPPAADSVPIGEITARAQLVVEEARALKDGLERSTDTAQLEADLVRLAERIEPQLSTLTAELDETPSIAMLSDLAVDWQGYERQIASREDRLRKQVASLEAQSESLAGSRDLWRRTRSEARARDVPAAILASIDAALDAIGQGAVAVEGALNDALVLQSQYGDLHATVQQVQGGIDAARTRVLDNLLVRDQPPLWDVELAEGLRRHWRVGAFAAELREAGLLYLVQNQDAVAVNLLAFALLYFALRRARAALARQALASEANDGTEAPDEAARLATRHPLAAAAVLALILAMTLFEDPPPSLSTAVRLFFVVPAVIVLRPLLGEVFRAPLYLLAAFFVVDRLRQVFTGATMPDRVVFTVEMVAFAAVLAALLRPGRLLLLPASARGNRWLGALGLWLRAAAFGAGIAALASVAGYARFALLIGGGVLGSGYAGLAIFALVRISEGLASALFGSHALAPVRMVDRHRALFLTRTRKLLRAGGVALWLFFVTGWFGVRTALARGARGIFNSSLGYGGVEVTLGGMLAFVVTLAGAWLFARMVRFVLDEEVFPRISLARGVPFALSTLVNYAILLAGLFMALSALGFDLDRITILLGAFGVGIGFGLQSVVNNFVSGLILLFERPIKVGDNVELQGLEGTVQRIGIRASVVRTGDGADVIVPNALLTTERVVNWTLVDRLRRVHLKVGVAYGSDPHRVVELLRGVVEKHPGVCAYPKPQVLFAGFGESSLDFEMRVWMDDPDVVPNTRSEVALAIHDALTGAGIDIPFPQRVLHVGSVAPAAAAALRGGAVEENS
jgi:small-conductance mechanosensitive channel